MFSEAVGKFHILALCSFQRPPLFFGSWRSSSIFKVRSGASSNLNFIPCSSALIVALPSVWLKLPLTSTVSLLHELFGLQWTHLNIPHSSAHLKISNLITSANLLLLYKITGTDSGDSEGHSGSHCSTYHTHKTFLAFNMFLIKTCFNLVLMPTQKIHLCSLPSINSLKEKKKLYAKTART